MNSDKAGREICEEGRGGGGEELYSDGGSAEGGPERAEMTLCLCLERESVL